MFRIGEFSKLTQVTIRMLRHYDDVGLLKPAEIDPWTGYRLYSVEQIKIFDKGIMRSEKKSKFPMYHDLLTRGPHL